MTENKTLKEKAQSLWEKAKFQADVSIHGGQVKGAEYAIRYYEKYRKVTYFIWFGAMVILLFKGYKGYALICAGVWHIQLMFNQMWWKLKHIEKWLQSHTKDGE